MKPVKEKNPPDVSGGAANPDVDEVYGVLVPPAPAPLPYPQEPLAPVQHLG